MSRFPQASRPDEPSTPRVLHLIKGLGPGGAERLILNQLLTSSGAIEYFVAYTVAEKSHLVADLEQRGASVTLLASPSPLELRTHIRSINADIIHVHSPVLAVGVRVLKALRLIDVGLVTTEHNRWPRHHRVTRAANRWTSSIDDYRIAVSEDVRRSMTGPIADTTTVLDHGVPHREIAERADRIAARRAVLGDDRADGAGPDGDSYTIVGIVANFRPEKAYDTFAKAAAIALEATPWLHLVVIGQGPGEDAFRAQAEDINRRVGGRLQVLGYRPDARWLMSGFDAFTLTSRHEGKPVSIMEAFALGLPVVATRAGGIPEAVIDDVNGILVDIDDADAVAAAWTRIASDGALRQRLASGASDSAADFDAAVATKSIESVYRSLLAS